MPSLSNDLTVIQNELSKASMSKVAVRLALKNVRTLIETAEQPNHWQKRRNGEKFLVRFASGPDVTVEGWKALCEFLDMREAYIRVKFSTHGQLFQRYLPDGRLALVVRQELWNLKDIPRSPDHSAPASGAARGRRPAASPEHQPPEELQNRFGFRSKAR